MNEEEAKTKWCPFVRKILVNAGFDTATHNRATVYTTAGTFEESESNKISPCIGSQCMAWRLKSMAEWSAKLKNATSTHNGRIIPPEKKGYYRAEDLEYIPEGYCGLAGKP